MSHEIEVEWEVDQWEASSTQIVTISAEDVEDYDTPEEAIKKIVEDEVRRDFENTIRWVFANHSELVEQIQEAINARKQREQEQDEEE